MSIKQSMIMILLFLGVSFSAYAGVSASSKSAPFHGQPFSDVSSYFAALDSCFNYYGWRRKSDASVQTNSSSGNQYVLMSTTVYRDNSCTQTNGSNRAKTIGFYTNISCNPPREFNELGKCEEPPEPQCPEGQIEGIEGDCMCKDGSKPNFLGVCEDYCNSDEFNALKREKIILCNNQYGDFSYTCN
ncbi:hypothetical protein, partial [Vibrio sinaloensis]|uniref:hypothetical protein n=1 Tax=Photobacterium sp. (strain ATCC 43367) TaxID=379097 RepID=UPI0035F09690